MKKILFLTVLILAFSAPALAQRGGGAPGPSGNGGGGGWGGGMGGGFGGSFGGGLPSCPRAQFAVVEVSGSNAEFEPSTFVPFEKAVAEGKQQIVAENRTVAEAARENNAARKQKARLAVVQDNAGYATITMAR